MYHHHDHHHEHQPTKHLRLRDRTPIQKYSARDSHDSRKLSTLLLLTSERLEHEALRADNAERRAADYISRLRAALDAKERADHDIARITEELRLYKVQLDAAQQEIFRAQEIVEQVEKARLEADADAAKARSLARQLQEQWAVMIAREEGRRQGYKDGLRRGRRVGFEEGRADGYADGEDDLRRQQDLHDDDRSSPRLLDEAPQAQAPISRPPSERPSSRQVLPLHPSPHSHRSRHDHDHDLNRPDRDPSHIPDVAPFATILPVPTLVTPDPSLRQSVPQSVPLAAPSGSPEPIHPRSLRSHRSRSRSRPPSPASTTDGWIPNADQNSFIAMPAPHELSNPAIAAVAAATTARQMDAIPESPSSQRQQPHVRSRDYAYPPTSQPPSRPRSSAAASRVSTRFSDFDLVSPPRRQRDRDHDRESDRDQERDHERDREREHSPRRSERSIERARGDDRDSHRDRNSSRGRNSTRSQPEQIAQEWRTANADVVIPPQNDPPPRSDPNWDRQRGMVEVPEPVVVAKRVQALENPVLVVRPDRPRTPILQSLFGKKKKSKKTKDKDMSVKPITNPSLTRDSSYSSVAIRIDPPSSSASNASDNNIAAIHAAHLLSPDYAHQVRPLKDDDDDDATAYQNSINNNNVPPLNVYSAVLAPPPVLAPVPPPPPPPPPPHHHSPRTAAALNNRSPRYEVAPIPPGVIYPDPPSRQRHPATATAASASPKPSARRRRDNLSSSPAPLDRPISLFSDPD